MKRLKFHRAIVAIAMMLIGWLPTLAYSFEINGVFYNVISTTEVEVTFKGNPYDSNSDEYSGNVVIPSSVNYNGRTYDVISIGDWAFEGCSSLTSIVIPNSVTSIGYSAFEGCSSLTDVVIGNSVTSIGITAFYKCSSLTSIQIPNSVTSIGYSAFWGCSSLTDVVIGNSVTSIGDYAFQECTSLTSVVIGNSVTRIGEGAFYECTSLTSIEIPNSVTSIGDYAFQECTSLISIEIPDSVTSIGIYAFQECTSLTDVVIGNSVTSIGGGAFYDCSSLTKIICWATTPPTIKSYTFSNYSANLYVPVGRVSAYQSADHWKNFYVKEIVSHEVGAMFSANGLNYVITVKEHEVAVDKWSTNYYSGDIVIPQSVEYGDVAYSVTSIGKYAFDSCGRLTSIKIPNSVKSIENYAFYSCKSLTSVEIPNSVTSIGSCVFLDCIGVTEITCHATTPPTIYSNTFSHYSATLYVPTGCISVYQSANYWKNFNIKEIPTISTSIVLNKTSASLKATETLTLVATILPENATDKSVTWMSSNESVATVDANGKVTAVAVGEATITATTADGSNKSATCKITVAKTLAASISLDKTSATLKATETLTLKATITPATTTDKSVTWKSSNEAVATVDANGKVTAVAVGEATITATTVDDSNLSASCKVTVVPTLAVSIELDQTEASVEEKSNLQLTATILPEHATNKEVAWSSSDKWVATVDNTGLVTIHSAGEVIITATTTDGSNLSATCRINVYSGIDGVNGDNVIVATIGDNIVVKNATAGSVVRVYTADGAMIASEVATEGDVIIEAPAKGIYVVKVGKQAVKVII